MLKSKEGCEKKGTERIWGECEERWLLQDFRGFVYRAKAFQEGSRT